MEIHIRESGSMVVAEVSGELNTEAAGTFLDTLSEYAATSDQSLAVDLSRLSLVNSIGLSAMVSLVTRARMSNARVVLVAPSSFVAGILSTTRLDSWFEIYDSVADAEHPLGA